MLKFNRNNMNEYELENNRVSYKTLIDRFIENKVLCNNIIEIDPYLYDNIVCGSIYNEELDEYEEIYQYYIISCNEYDIDFINEFQKENNSNDIIIAYSEVLDNYVLLVTHFGTSWSYVLTDIESSFY